MKCHLSQAVAVLLLLFLSGCGPGPKDQPAAGTSVPVKPPEGNQASNYVTSFDQEVMKRISSEARKTSFLFIEALASRKETMRGFAVKKGFAIPGVETVEDIWLTDVTFDGTNFTGTVSNNPVETQEVRRGDVVRVPPAELSDWMYIDDGVLRGGYTIRLITRNQSREEREQFEQKAGFTIQ
jgi:uncharacterized protein YegJ (DUF2314 family)